MRPNIDPDRPPKPENTSRRKDNAGRPDGLGYKLDQTLATAPEDPSLRQIASVAWVAYERGRDPADVWPEILEKTGGHRGGSRRE